MQSFLGQMRPETREYDKGLGRKHFQVWQSGVQDLKFDTLPQKFPTLHWLVAPGQRKAEEHPGGPCKHSG